MDRVMGLKDVHTVQLLRRDKDAVQERMRLLMCT